MSRTTAPLDCTSTCSKSDLEQRFPFLLHNTGLREAIWNQLLAFNVTSRLPPSRNCLQDVVKFDSDVIVCGPGDSKVKFNELSEVPYRYLELIPPDQHHGTSNYTRCILAGYFAGQWAVIPPFHVVTIKRPPGCDRIQWEPRVAGTAPSFWEEFNVTGVNLISAANLNMSGPLPKLPAVNEKFTLEFIDLSGNNFSGSVPAAYFSRPPLWKPNVALNISGNRLLTGEAHYFSVPVVRTLFVSPRSGVWDLRGTGVLPPSVATRQRVCTEMMEGVFHLTIRHQETWFFGPGTTRALTRTSFQDKYGIPTWWCGKDVHLWHILAAWSAFMVLLVVSTLLQWQRDPKTTKDDHGSRWHTPSWVRSAMTWLRSTQWLKELLSGLLVAVDVASDIYLIVTLFRFSHSSIYQTLMWMILVVAVFLPDMLCSVAVAFMGLGGMKQRLGYAKAYFAFPSICILTVLTFPFLILTLTIMEAFKMKRPQRGVLGHYLNLRLGSMVGALSALKALVEDAVVSIVLCVGAVRLSQNAFSHWTIYSPPAALWLSLSLAMLHMLMEWWTFMGKVLEHKGLSWVNRSFWKMKKGGGGDDDDDDARERSASGGIVAMVVVAFGSGLAIGVVVIDSRTSGEDSHWEWPWLFAAVFLSSVVVAASVGMVVDAASRRKNLRWWILMLLGLLVEAMVVAVFYLPFRDRPYSSRKYDLGRMKNVTILAPLLTLLAIMSSGIATFIARATKPVEGHPLQPTEKTCMLEEHNYLSAFTP